MDQLEGRTLRTICHMAKCSTCGKTYFFLQSSGAIVQTTCDCAWKQGPQAEIKTSTCPICDGAIITDPSGQVRYWMLCRCFRDGKGEYACNNPSLEKLGLAAVGAEFVYTQSYEKEILLRVKKCEEFIEKTAVGLVALIQRIEPIVEWIDALKNAPEPEPEAMIQFPVPERKREAIWPESIALTDGIRLPNGEFRCKFFLGCGKAGGSKKTCKDEAASKECEHFKTAMAAASVTKVCIDDKGNDVTDRCRWTEEAEKYAEKASDTVRDADSFATELEQRMKNAEKRVEEEGSRQSTKR